MGPLDRFEPDWTTVTERRGSLTLVTRWRDGSLIQSIAYPDDENQSPLRWREDGLFTVRSNGEDVLS